MGIRQATFRLAPTLIRMRCITSGKFIKTVRVQLCPLGATNSIMGACSHYAVGLVAGPPSLLFSVYSLLGQPSGLAMLQCFVDEQMTDTERRIFTQPLALEALGRYLIRLHRVSVSPLVARFVLLHGIRVRVDSRPHPHLLMSPGPARATVDASQDAMGMWRLKGTGAIVPKPLIMMVAHPTRSETKWWTVMGLPIVVSRDSFGLCAPALIVHDPAVWHRQRHVRVCNRTNGRLNRSLLAGVGWSCRNEQLPCSFPGA